MRIFARASRWLLLLTLFVSGAFGAVDGKPLPRVLLIGDSISQGYQKEVRRLLQGRAEVVRNHGNAEYTGTGVREIEEWLGDGKWDVIHFNWGLWDMYGWRYAKEDRSPQAYEERLEMLVRRIKQTGARMIWATTTPPCPEPEVTMRRQFKTDVVISPELEKAYLDAARRVMERHGVSINDLNALIRPDLDKYSPDPADVHFTAEGSARLGAQVVRSIEKELGDRLPARTFEWMQETLEPARIIPYRKEAGRELSLHVFQPDGFKAGDRRPAHVVIHGGGWRNGDPRRFYPYANSLVSEGYVGISVGYRLVGNPEGTTVFDCVKDARAAIRFVRANASDLGVDPNRITVGGGSAGAHLALGTALFDELDHADQDLSVPCRPDALVLLFAVLDTSPAGYGNQLIGEEWRSISPRHQIRAGMPPTLVFHGDKDRVASEAILNDFCERMRAKGNVCELVLEKGGVHGHINRDIDLFDDAARRTASFLKKRELGPK